MLATDLADVLRAAGVKVVEVPGWKAASHRPMIAVKGVICHHTAGPPHATGTPSLNVVIHGRPDVSGPLCNIYLATDGTAYTVAAGRANHAGVGQFAGMTDGGSNFLGIEAENAGVPSDPWVPAQVAAYAKICAALATHYDFSPGMVIGHKEWAMPRGRKIDPSFDMNAFRSNVAHLMAGATSSPPPVPSAHPHDAILKKGDRGGSVAELQEKLGIKADGIFGPATEAAVKAFQSRKGLTPDGMVGPLTWKALLA